MTSENNDEKKFKQCLQSLIDAVTDTGNFNEQKFINDLKKKIENLLEKYLSILSIQCRNYLLNLLYQYDYNEKNKTFSNTFKKDMLNRFRHDLEGQLASLDVFQAAWNGDQSAVEDFLQTYPSLKDQSGLYETTLLYSAARNNHFDLVKYLIEVGRCSVNAPNEEYLSQGQESTDKPTIGSTPLHAACYHGHLDIVKYLIAHGGDYFQLNNANESPLQNGKSKSIIRKFFKEFLISGYAKQTTHPPVKTILQEIEESEEPIVDCIWEYKPFKVDQWYQFAPDPADQLQSALINKKLKLEFNLRTGRDTFNVSMVQFLRSGKNDDHAAWIRCRGSSLLNFQYYSQWQIMFIKHPKGTPNSSLSSIQIFYLPSNKIQLNSWYNVDNEMNILFETAMNYRRRYVNIDLGGKVTVDLENFALMNEQNTIEGFLRWIPKMISDMKDLTPIDNFELKSITVVMLLTISCVKLAENNGDVSEDEMKQFNLKYENAFQDDDLEFVDKVTSDNELNKLVSVIQGDLLAENIDVIVVCSLSKYLVESVFKAAGKSFVKSYNAKVEENEMASVISVIADGQLGSKAVYFVPWKPNPDPKKLCQSIEQLIKSVMKKAASENYQSIAFPAIGCGEYGCPINLIAETFIRQVRELLPKYPISIRFVIQPEKTDVYEEFRKQLGPSGQQDETTASSPVSLNIGKGIIEIEKGNITKQKVDVIIASSSSENLQQSLLAAAGDQVRTAYAKERKANPNSLLISTPPGQLHCKRIFFLKWEPDNDPELLQQSIADLILNVIQNVLSHNYTSIAFPAIGCGEHACSVDVVVKTMVREMKKEIQKRKLPWTVKFIIEPNQQNVYDEFSKQLLSSDSPSDSYEIPSTWERTDDDQIRVIVSKKSGEYKSIISKFDETMKGKYTEIIKLERIQNERWYMQYMAHAKDFKKRLKEDTEKRLYHGCLDHSADAIIKDCFNRSFAGVNGVAYGVGVYFSSDASYSHGYAKPNSNGERCMFVARVLVGKTTLGNSSMKTRPLGYDSTTDGKHITVTYHDAQAFAEYLITYK